MVRKFKHRDNFPLPINSCEVRLNVCKEALPSTTNSTQRQRNGECGCQCEASSLCLLIIKILGVVSHG